MVAKLAVRPDAVVVPSPVLDEHLRFLKGVEDLCIQEFISELAIEGFDIAVLPGTTGFDE